MDEAGRDQGLADASRAGKQVSVRRAVAQFGEQPIRNFAVSTEGSQGHRRVSNSWTGGRISSPPLWAARSALITTTPAGPAAAGAREAARPFGWGSPRSRP